MTMRETEDKSFGPKEAEGMVSRLRGCLREADRLHNVGEESAAAQKESAANAQVEIIVNRSKKRLERYARGYFSGNEATVEDAIVEMTIEVCRRLKNLESYAAFEVRFNLCFKHAVMDAAKKVRRENGLDMHGQPDTQGYHVVSGEALSVTDDGTGVSWEERVSDPAATDFVARVLGEGLAAQLIARLPTPRHIRIFENRSIGMEWEEVAACENICSKTTKRIYDEARAILRHLVSGADAQNE